MYAGRIISYYANNGHISEIYFYRPSYLLQKSVDMLLHVTAGKLIRADNNRHSGCYRNIFVTSQIIFHLHTIVCSNSGFIRFNG